MLRADTHELTHLFHLIEQIHIVATRTALRLFDQAREHGNQCGFSSAIMAQKSENLAVVHLDIDSPDGAETTTKGLLDVFNAEVITRGFQALADDGGRFVVFLRHLIPFKRVIFFSRDQALAAWLDIDLATNAFSSAARIVARHAKEARVESLTKFRRDNLVQVETHHEKDQEVDKEHPKCRIKRVLVINHGSSRTVQAHASRFVVGKLNRALHESYLRQ